GSVFLVRCKQDGQIYALKQVRISENDIHDGYVNPSRESSINEYLLQHCSSSETSYFVNMKDQFYTRRTEKTLWNNMVLEYVGLSLSTCLTQSHTFSKLDLIRSLIQELHFLHSNNIVHRDLKPSNILMDLSRKHIKFCDFGCSKRILGNPDSHRSTPLVTSRFYRAPELLMGATHYAFAIDIWSLGCVIAEILLGHPLFVSLDSDGDQLVSIINVLGLPTEEDMVQMQIPKANRDLILGIRRIDPLPFDSFFPSDIDMNYITLLHNILQYDPTKRPTAQQLMEYPLAS
ncbi:hypothetical protein WA171_006989, partial [Blastocystis sp. BT1]